METTNLEKHLTRYTKQQLIDLVCKLHQEHNSMLYQDSEIGGEENDQSSIN